MLSEHFVSLSSMQMRQNTLCDLWWHNYTESLKLMQWYLRTSISFNIDRWRRLSFLFLLFFEILYSDAYIFPFLLCFSLLFFSQLFVRPPQTAILLFLHFFSMVPIWGWSWSLSPVQCHTTSIHSSSGTVSIRSSPLNLFLTSTV